MVRLVHTDPAALGAYKAMVVRLAFDEVEKASLAAAKVHPARQHPHTHLAALIIALIIRMSARRSRSIKIILSTVYGSVGLQVQAGLLQDRLGSAGRLVEEALLLGLTVRCLDCGQGVVKDDECMHIDSW